MKPFRLLLLFVLLLLCFSSFAQSQNSLAQATEAVQVADDDFSPMLFALLFVVMFIFIVVGMVLTVLALLILFGLVSAGVVSASLLVGLYKRSATAAFKTAFYLSSAIGGGLFFGLVFHFFSTLLSLSATLTDTLFSACVGIVVGLIFAFVALLLIRRLTAFLKKRY